jgi:hypothetical protein
MRRGSGAVEREIGGGWKPVETLWAENENSEDPRSAGTTATAGEEAACTCTGAVCTNGACDVGMVLQQS